MREVTEKQLNFLRDLKILLTKHNATLTSFEGELIVEFEDSNNYWFDEHTVSKDTIKV